MLRNLSVSTAKRVYKALPPGIRERAHAALTPRSYAHFTRGLGPDTSASAWAADHPRPVSIVIPSYNDAEFLAECLTSIDETCGAFDYEVIIVDDFCQPANSSRLRMLEGDRRRIIFKERREGFAVAVNRGMAEARFDIVVLNSDIVAKPGWLSSLQRAAYAIDDRIGMVSPKLVYPDGRIQYAGTYWARVLAPQWFGHLFVGSAANRPVANVSGYNRSISGACVYVTRAAYTELGGLDEGYWLGFEDVDWGLSAWSKGIRCYYEPKAMLIHHESATRGYSQGTRELQSMRRFWDRWGDRFLERRVSTDAVQFVRSAASEPMWAEYVDDLAARLVDAGLPASVVEVAGPGPDEAAIARLQGEDQVLVCCDWGAAATAWLATLETGAPAYLLPTVESGSHGDDPALQAEIIAGYRPEFEYIAPNRWTADQLRAETAWESRGRIPAAIRPPARDSGAADLPVGAVFIGLRPDALAPLSRAAESVAAAVLCLDMVTPESIRMIESARPRVIVDLSRYENSVVPLRLMAMGAVLIAAPSDRNGYEILDGYNAFLVDPNDLDGLERALRTVLEDESVYNSVASNGRDTAERLARTGTTSMIRAIEDIGARST